MFSNYIYNMEKNNLENFKNIENKINYLSKKIGKSNNKEIQIELNKLYDEFNYYENLEKKHEDNIKNKIENN